MLVGLALLVASAVYLNRDVTCGTVVMVPGQVCVDRGKVVSFAQRKADGQRTGWFLLGGGVLLTLASGGYLGLLVRDRRRAATVVPPTAP
ncbi:MAG: hypothetical protein AUI14_02565 [Actinobacteria bacterium 13_2_20CM_2_71_6]|nr:MAG: hypothetical protein AUI14_02565 [Actinobacteria bacterium 13_2_20CM_2_71_6]